MLNMGVQRPELRGATEHGAIDNVFYSVLLGAANPERERSEQLI